MEETAREWFKRTRKVSDSDIKRFELIDTDYYEFTAMIKPWMSDVPAEYSGIIYRTAPNDGAEWSLEYE